MLAVPAITAVDIAFGNIAHMPKYAELPEQFQDWHNEAHCRAVNSWFMKGAKAVKGGIELDGVTYKAKPDVEAVKALAAIRAVLASWEPKHEHKIAACGYMLSEWFEKQLDTVAAK